MATDWYRTLELAPPLDVAVHVMWFGTTFTAVRRADVKAPGRSRATRVRWATLDGNRLVYLPPLGHETKWGDDPLLYQPIDPADYFHALPFPVGADGLRKTVDAQPVLPPKPHREVWRDHTGRYSPPGSITPREAEGRMMRAIMVEASMPRSDLLTIVGWLARMVMLVEMAEGKRPSYWHDRFQPTAKDLSDIATVVPWLVAVASQSRTIQMLRMRACDPPYSWQAIAELPEWSCSRERVRQVYQHAIMTATRTANGVPNKHTAKADRAMAALRERNRVHALQR